MKDYPKLETPYERIRNGRMFTLSDSLVPDHSWFETEEVDAVDKLDGTNVSVKVVEGVVVEAYNRNTPIVLGSGKGFDKFITEGLEKAKELDWVKEGVHYGELIGPKINQNRHKMYYHLWVPFDWLRENCKFDEYPRKYAELSEWFKTIPSPFNKKMKFPDILAEGVVFYRKKTDAKVKIRRDMFEWYSGVDHRGGAVVGTGEVSTGTDSKMEGKFEGDIFTPTN